MATSDPTAGPHHGFTRVERGTTGELSAGATRPDGAVGIYVLARCPKFDGLRPRIVHDEYRYLRPSLW